jgi:hypothetical protein
MNDPKLAIAKIEEILTKSMEWEFSSRLGAYATIMRLIDELSEHAETAENIDKGYCSEKIVALKWHVGAIFGFDIDNGHPVSQHLSWAVSAIQTLRRIFQDVD